MKRTIITFNLLIHFLLCSAQYDESIYPFTLDTRDYRINLPDSLAKKELSGYALVLISLNKSGRVKDFQIVKLVIEDPSDSTVLRYQNLDIIGSLNNDTIKYNFLSFNEYPVKVKDFYYPVKEYTKKLKFKKVENENVAKKYIFVIRAEIDPC